MHEAGVNFGIGTDGAASNNRLDMFAEMRLAALLAKGASGKAEALPAHAALRAATLNGARALGIDLKTGSISAGKWADLTAVDLSRIELQPVYDAVSHLVYVAERNDVSDVWVAGNRVVKKQQLTTIEKEELESAVLVWQNCLK